MLLDFLLIFILVFAFSYFSNIPPGFVNVKVVENALFKNYASGVRVALGAATAEFTYCAAAIYTALYLQKFPKLFYGINVFVALLLLVLAIKYFTGKSYAQQVEEAKINFQNESKNQNSFLTGIIAGFLNPQMFPFWFIFYTGIFYPLFPNINKMEIYLFIIAAVAGGFSLLWTYAFFANKYRDKIFTIFATQPINIYVGIMFLIMAVIKIVQLVQKFPPS